jgi:Xaa-Pro aminopeptidase
MVRLTEVSRLAGLRAAMAAESVDLLALAPSDSLRYAIGFSPIPDERLCLLLLAADAACIVLPALTAEQAAAAAPDLPRLAWTDHTGPDEALRTGLARSDDVRRIAVDPEMRADILLLLQGHAPSAEIVSGEAVLSTVRMIKFPDEIALLTASAQTADAAIASALQACRPGASELDVARAVDDSFRAAGVDVTFIIVASGPNGAFPHHHSGDRVLKTGDAVVIDIGGRLQGYSSDITRMAFVGEPTERYREVHGIVEAAVQAGMAAARPGAIAADVDRAARTVIEDAGYGEYFVHRTGHGLGLSTHERPWIRSDVVDEVLPKGSVFSIEPGIYLPGEFGVRLEEIVTLTASGCERFSGLPRDVHVVPA